MSQQPKYKPFDRIKLVATAVVENQLCADKFILENIGGIATRLEQKFIEVSTEVAKLHFKVQPDTVFFIECQPILDGVIFLGSTKECIRDAKIFLEQRCKLVDLDPMLFFRAFVLAYVVMMVRYYVGHRSISPDSRRGTGEEPADFPDFSRFLDYERKKLSDKKTDVMHMLEEWRHCPVEVREIAERLGEIYALHRLREKYGQILEETREPDEHADQAERVRKLEKDAEGLREQAGPNVPPSKEKADALLKSWLEESKSKLDELDREITKRIEGVIEKRKKLEALEVRIKELDRSLTEGASEVAKKEELENLQKELANLRKELEELEEPGRLDQLSDLLLVCKELAVLERPDKIKRMFEKVKAAADQNGQPEDPDSLWSEDRWNKIKELVVRLILSVESDLWRFCIDLVPAGGDQCGDKDSG